MTGWDGFDNKDRSRLGLQGGEEDISIEVSFILLYNLIDLHLLSLGYDIANFSPDYVHADNDGRSRSTLQAFSRVCACCT